MLYCKECWYPDSKPDLAFENGVCSACINFKKRKDIDWGKRKEDLIAILEKYKSRDGSNWDCVVPSSAGKDSTFQALKIRELGYNPLVVTATTDYLTDIGRRNIENLKNQGFDCIEFTPNPVLRKKIMRFALETVGDIELAEHLAIFGLPIRVAQQMGIKLVVYGECSQNEYGGPKDTVDARTIDRRWLEEFGGLNGMRLTDISEMLDIPMKYLIPYKYPEASDVCGIFLGAFLDWDGWRNALIAQAYGFETYPHCVEGSLANYENVDSGVVGAHDYFKYLKFGFGRATDIANNHIRRGRLTREEAKPLIQRHDGKFPSEYVGVKLQTLLDYIGMTMAEFLAVCEKFRNKKIFDGDKLRSPLE